ncbi:MAG: RluA family pseudouridine synthase [Verrucomicrobia bacterium]|nr:RluA family pseudouridine synthase [Verrucomicrobiota bacterium]MDA1086687.1 RluA family pseudouridine synthase [Verrucomicrobiota bacterium]
MSESPKPFKKPPKRHVPKGLSILYEDRDILVVDKASGLLTVSTEKVRENTAYYLLTTYVRKGNQKSRRRVVIVHRLDRDTSGVMVFAKDETAKRFLQEAWPGFRKKYYALVHGAPPEKEGVITSYLAENSAHKVYSVSDAKNGKLARTGYRVLKTSAKYSLLEIDLLTGRKNQIRVQLADQGCPVAGDKKYGPGDKGIKRLTLHAASLTILHPFSKKEMTFETGLPVYFETLLRSSNRTASGER